MCCVLAATLVGALVLPSGSFAAPLESTRGLVAQLRRSGRAEAVLGWTVAGPPGRAAETRSGRLALEPPSLARLDVQATGESITLRDDGGEWLQPSLKQLVRLSPRHSVAAMRWWRLLIGSAASGGDDAGGATGSRGSSGARGAAQVKESRLSPRRYRLVVSGDVSSAADSAEVWLNARGLPARLVLADGEGGRQAYRLSGWRFMRARGAPAFRVSLPSGMESVELP